jgi:hypothetical protein
MPIKKLYSFTIDKEQEVDETVISKDDKGAEVKTITKAKKNVPQKFFVRQPNQTLKEEAQWFHGKVFADGMKRGLLTNALLVKKYDDDNGFFSDKEQTRYIKLYSDLIQNDVEYKRLSIKADKTEEDKTKEKEILGENIRIRQEIQSYQTTKQNLFSATADSIAENKTIIWWILNLAYKDDEKEGVEFFGEGDYAKKLNKLEEIEDSEDAFDKKAMTEFIFYITLWAYNQVKSPKEFEELVKTVRGSDNETNESK